MVINISEFYRINIIDTCSIWNILSSKLFYQASLNAKCYFSCTKFVIYECLHKYRKSPSTKEIDLQNRLMNEQTKGNFKEFHINIEDLQEVDILSKRKNLSKGELSSIVFAKSIGQAFLTDDQGARKLASEIIESKMVQTTPQLFGWLIYEGFLIDTDKPEIIKDHLDFNRPLAKFFDQVYLTALAIKLTKKN